MYAVDPKHYDCLAAQPKSQLLTFENLYFEVSTVCHADNVQDIISDKLLL